MSDDRPGHEELRRGLDRLASDAPGPSERRERTVSRARRRARLGVAAVSAGAVAFSVAAVFAVGAVRGLDRGDRPVGPTPTGTVKPQPSNSEEPTVRAEGAIAYWSDRSPPGGEARLMVTEADGTGTHEVGRLSISTSRLSWSPDGQHIVFDHGTGEGSGELEVIETTMGNTRTLFDVVQPSEPDYSPDGSRIAFSTDSGALFTIAAADGSGSDPIRRYGPDAYLEGSDPSWAPTGDRIAFIARDGDVGIVRVAGTTGPRFLHVGGTAKSLDWGPNGLVVAVFRRGDGESLVAVDPDSTASPQPLPNPPGEEFDPSVSPDGRFVAFSSDAGGTTDIYVMDLNTGAVDRLTNDERFDFAPDWRPAS
jgi:Tol biopolymer transport system component